MRLDQLLNLTQRVTAEPGFVEAIEQVQPCLGHGPHLTQRLFAGEELRQGQRVEQARDELLGRQRFSVGVEERRRRHVLNRSMFAVAQLDADLRLRRIKLVVVSGFRIVGRVQRWEVARHRRRRVERLTIPVRIGEQVVGVHEVVDREVVLAVEQARPAADDLLELDHRIDRAHQHDVAHVAGINPGRQLLRRRQDRRDRLLVVLEVPQRLIANRAVISRNALAVVRVRARRHLVDDVAHHQRVLLRRAEHDRLLVLVDLIQEQPNAVFLALANDDRLVEVGLDVALAEFDLTVDHDVVRGVEVVVDRGVELAHAERGEEPVLDAVLERVCVDRLAEVVVGVDVALALRGRSET